jgi:hypothetical protein
MESLAGLDGGSGRRRLQQRFVHALVWTSLPPTQRVPKLRFHDPTLPLRKVDRNPSMDMHQPFHIIITVLGSAGVRLHSYWKPEK